MLGVPSAATPTRAADASNRTETSVMPRRPQAPRPPFPYRSDEVAFENAAAKIRLAGTLTLPSGTGPFPTVLLVSGSGPQDRDETIFGHQPFLLIADALARRGIASLRCDDRGVAKSGGDFGTATTADFASDASAALAYLRSRPEVDGRALGILGHSEGGMVGPMVAADDPALGFLVLLAAPGIGGVDLLMLQKQRFLEASGVDAARVAQIVGASRKLYSELTHARDATEAQRIARANIAGQPDARNVPAALIDGLVAEATSPWLLYYLGHDPAATLGRVRCPVLALYGAKDLQVPPAENAPAVRKALAANPDASVVVLPGFNHLFQTAGTGLMSEYAEIEETVAPAVLTTIGDWILERAKPTGVTARIPARD